MKHWKITWYEFGLKSKTIKMPDLYNLTNRLIAAGIPEWAVIKIEMVDEPQV